MNTKVSPLLLKDTEVELALNFSLDTTGALTKRNGYDVYASQPVAGKTIVGLYQFTHTGTPAETTQMMVANSAADANTVIYYNNAGTWTLSKADTAITTFNNTNRYRFATFLDYVFRVNGTAVVATSTNVDGASWGTTDAPTVITPSFIRVYEDRVYTARNGAALGSRVYFSGLPSSDTISWTTATDWFDVNPDDGDEITALENNGNRLLIFKNRALYRWKFGQVESDRLIGIGTKSQECVKTNLDLGITFFANEYGVYAYTSGRPKKISRKINKWIEACSATDVSLFNAETDDDHYYLYLADSLTVDSRTYTNVMAIYTVSLDAWVIYTLDKPVRVMSKLIVSGEENIYFGSTNGRTYKFDSGTADDSGGDNGDTAVPIAGEIISKEYLLSFPTKSDIQHIDIISNQQSSAQALYSLDRNEEFKPLGELTKRVNDFSAQGECHTARIKIADNSQTISVIEGFNFQYEPKPTR